MCAEWRISIFWVEKSWHFHLSLSLLPSFFFFLVQCFWSWEFTKLYFRGKRFGELETYGIRRKEVQVVSGGFSSPFSAQLYIFFVFLSGLLDLIVMAFYVIFIFLLLHCHTKKDNKLRLINIKFKINILLGWSDCGAQISEKPTSL